MLLVYEPYVEEYGAKNNLNHLAPCIFVSSSPDMPGISISRSQLTRLGGRREALSRFGLEPELTAPTKLYKTAPTGVPGISSSGSTFDSHFFFAPAMWKWKWSHLVVSNSLQPHGLQSTRLLGPWDFPGKNTGVGCHFLLQGIFLTQGSNPGLPHCRQTLYHLSHRGSFCQRLH